MSLKLSMALSPKFVAFAEQPDLRLSPDFLKMRSQKTSGGLYARRISGL
jgi:hypothetical protein